ncbi:MAG: CAP domain-containing protein [Pseudooceanicola sp.]
MRRLAIALLCVLAACGGSAPSDAPPSPDRGDDSVIAAMNDARAAAGLAPLSADARLTEAARTHAADMIRRGYFAHNTPEGDGPSDRASAAGYEWCFVAENIAQGQSGVAEVMESWMNSPGHRANILHARPREAGVARLPGTGRSTWVSVFAAPC